VDEDVIIKSKDVFLFLKNFKKTFKFMFVAIQVRFTENWFSKKTTKTYLFLFTIIVTINIIVSYYLWYNIIII
jgi:hypothetical protein